ncbi:MAG: class I tRNA ligase family protein [Chloroflexi bacterium]|nr:class I tRNA ligase family protein [Chloroflexota bacterium]
MPFVRVWMHVAMVRKDGEKMSKSLGNLVWVSELLKTYTPDAIRLYLASHHYRDSWEWNADEMSRCAEVAERWRSAAGAWLFSAEWHQIDAAMQRQFTLEAGLLLQQMSDALDDDLDTRRAVGALDELAMRAAHEQSPTQERQRAQHALRIGAGLLGLRLGARIVARVRDGWARHLQRFASES